MHVAEIKNGVVEGVGGHYPDCFGTVDSLAVAAVGVFAYINFSLSFEGKADSDGSYIRQMESEVHFEHHWLSSQIRPGRQCTAVRIDELRSCSAESLAHVQCMVSWVQTNLFRSGVLYSLYILIQGRGVLPFVSRVLSCRGHWVLLEY